LQAHVLCEEDMRMTDEAEQSAKRKCAGGDCDKDADSLQCPTCQKLGKESYFCSQDCFKRNWVRLVPLPAK